MINIEDLVKFGFGDGGYGDLNIEYNISVSAHEIVSRKKLTGINLTTYYNSEPIYIEAITEVEEIISYLVKAGIEIGKIKKISEMKEFLQIEEPPTREEIGDICRNIIWQKEQYGNNDYD